MIGKWQRKRPVTAFVLILLTLSTCRVADTTSPSSNLGAPWVFVTQPGEGERVVTPPSGSILVPCISLTEPPSSTSPQPEAGDSCDGDYDDGPEYLAIGNLGQRSRRSSRSSTHSSEQSETPDLTPQRGSLVPPPPRRSSFSEGQRGQGRGSRGHTRSFSDTGINQKLRNGEFIRRTIAGLPSIYFYVSYVVLNYKGLKDTSKRSKDFIYSFI